MTSDYEQRRAAQAKRLQDEEQAERQKEIILGETSGKAEKDIRSGQELKVKVHDVNDLLRHPGGFLVIVISHGLAGLANRLGDFLLLKDYHPPVALPDLPYLAQ